MTNALTVKWCIAMSKVVKKDPSNNKPDTYRRVEVLAAVVSAVAAVIAAFAALLA